VLVTYYVIQGSSWINIGLTPITENCYNCSRQKQIPIFNSYLLIAPGKSKFLSFNCSRQKQIPIFENAFPLRLPRRLAFHRPVEESGKGAAGPGIPRRPGTIRSRGIAIEPNINFSPCDQPVHFLVSAWTGGEGQGKGGYPADY